MTERDASREGIPAQRPQTLDRDRTALELFVQRLVESRLMTAEEVERFLGGLPAERRPATAEDLARALFQAGKLTRYQTHAVYQGKTKGLVFGDYRVLDRLGQGGMGLVLKAEHRRMQRVVAVKILPPGRVRSPAAVERFYREMQAAARLNHPHIVQAYDAGEHEGMHYLVMEYVEGKDLAAVLKDRGPLPLALAVECLVQAARILSQPCGLAIGAKAITISTVGLVPAIRRFTAERHRYRLVVSLTSADPAERRRLMPVEQAHPTAELIQALREYHQVTGQRITLAWTMMAGINTRAQDARRLAELTRGLPIKLNLIDVNDATGRFRPPSREELKAFRDALTAELQMPVSRRYSGGRDIHAACGMLAGGASCSSRSA